MHFLRVLDRKERFYARRSSLLSQRFVPDSPLPKPARSLRCVPLLRPFDIAFFLLRVPCLRTIPIVIHLSERPHILMHQKLRGSESTRRCTVVRVTLWTGSYETGRAGIPNGTHRDRSFSTKGLHRVQKMPQGSRILASHKDVIFNHLGSQEEGSKEEVRPILPCI